MNSDQKLAKLAQLFSPNIIKFLYNGLVFYYPHLTNPKVVFEDKNKNYPSAYGTYTNEGFEYVLYQMLKDVLESENPDEVYKKITQLMKLQESNKITTPERVVEAATPDEIRLREQVEALEKVKTQGVSPSTQASVNAARATQIAIARQQELHDQQARRQTQSTTLPTTPKIKEPTTPQEKPMVSKEPAITVEPSSFPTEKAAREMETPAQPHVYLKYAGGIKDEEITPVTIEKIKILSQAAHESPREFEETMKNAMIASLPIEIKSKMSEGQVNTAATLIAVDLTNKLLETDPTTANFSKPIIDPLTEVLPNLIDPNRADFVSAVPDEKLRTQIAGMSQTGLLELAATEDTLDMYLSSALGDTSVVTHFYGSDPTGKWKVVKNKADADVEFSPFNAIDHFKQTSQMRSMVIRTVELKNPGLLDKLGDKERAQVVQKFVDGVWLTERRVEMSSGTRSQVIEALSHPKSIFIASPKTQHLIERWVKNNTQLLTPQGLAASAVEITTTYAAQGYVVMPIVSVGLPYLGASIGIIPNSGFALQFSAQLGPKTFSYLLGGGAKKAAETGVHAVGTSAAKTLATRAGTTVAGAGAKTVVAAGAEAAIPGIGLGAAALTLLYSARHWIKRNFSKIATTAAGLTALAGVVTASPILLMAGGGIALVGGIASAGGVVPFMASAGGATAGFLGAVTGSVAGTLGAIAAATAITVPILVAFILLIINNSAYVVPPPIGAYREVENPYIGVDKKANPPGPFENNVLDDDEVIEYTITITAKKSGLTNIKFQEVCNVSQEGKTPDCPSPDPSLQAPPAEILAGASFSFKYTRKFDKKFYDSATTDVFTVSADSADQAGVSDSDSATVIFGDPPLDCPSGWPIPLPQMGQSSLSITQGPRGTYSHTSYSEHEAIDIGTNHIEGFDIIATHRGVVTAAKGSGENGGYGKYVDVQSVCEGNSFVSRFAHLSVVSVSEGETIDFNRVVGLSGNTGASSGPHLHYGFYDGAATYLPMGPYPDNPPYMHPIYIPKEVPYGCPEYCGTIL